MIILCLFASLDEYFLLLLEILDFFPPRLGCGLCYTWSFKHIAPKFHFYFHGYNCVIMSNKLLGVLLRFRQYRYAIMSDVESMYLHVRVPERDRNTLRFLWFEGESIAHYRMTSHLFAGVWCAARMPFDRRRSTSDLVKDTIANSFYVDDMLRSVSTYEEASEVMTGTKDTLIKGGFNLTKFVCNDLSLLEQVPVDDRASEV